MRLKAANTTNIQVVNFMKNNDFDSKINFYDYGDYLKKFEFASNHPVQGAVYKPRESKLNAVLVQCHDSK